MRAMLMSTVGLMALAVSSGIGLAADLMVEAPIDVPASMFDWGGAYAGIVIGGGQTNVDYDDDDGTQLGQGSLAAFAVAGYNWVDGSILYGIEGDVGVLRGNGDVTDQSDTVWSDDTLNGAVVTLRGRLGYATENLLLYGTAGLAVTSDDYQADYLASFWNGSAVRVGAVIGAGVEVAVTDTMSLKAEGRYYAFGEGEAENDELHLHVEHCRRACWRELPLLAGPAVSGSTASHHPFGGLSLPGSRRRSRALFLFDPLLGEQFEQPHQPGDVLLSEQVDLFVQGFDVEFGAEVHVVVELGLLPVDGGLAVLRHHQHRRGEGGLE